MRLIDTSSLILSTFTDNALPEYAILSHTWGTGEVDLEEMMAKTAAVEAKPGFEKIRKCCSLAAKEHCQYAWVDTCCIDKTSSAELSESINSMYRWYRQAKVCYAFLSDVPAASAFRDDDPLFNRSRWFTRGWTLQELLAPVEVIFFSAEWQPIGTKSSLANRISTVTGISQEILTGHRDLQTVSIARRMSWAAARNTTRTEDMAYCLMGIFDINMAMLYGEGEKAFIRLQEEIVRSTEDQSIFAWEDSQASDDDLLGLLAPHPRCFATTGSFEPYSDFQSEDSIMTLTNQGLTLRVRQHSLDNDGLTAMFNCAEQYHFGSFAFIHVFPLAETGSKFARVRARTLGRGPRRGVFKSMVVKQNPRRADPPKALEGQQWFCIKSLQFPQRFVMGGERLEYYTVAETSAIRPLGTTEIPATRAEGHTVRRYDSPSNFLFQLPQSPRQTVVTLHIISQDRTGFPFWYHAEIYIAALAGGVTPFAVAALFRISGEKEYEEPEVTSDIEGEQKRLANAQFLPATVEFQVEDPVVVDATLAWEEIEGETVACISLEVKDKSG